MSSLRLIISALGCALAVACQSTPVASSDPGSVAGPSTLSDGAYTLVVHGMSCPKCVSNVELQLERIGGVTHPVVDMKNGFVHVDVEGGRGPSKGSITTAIADAGFTLVEIRGGKE